MNFPLIERVASSFAHNAIVFRGAARHGREKRERGGERGTAKLQVNPDVIKNVDRLDVVTLSSSRDMGVCRRRMFPMEAGTSFYAWQGWAFLTTIGVIIALSLFWYNYINVRRLRALGDRLALHRYASSNCPIALG